MPFPAHILAGFSLGFRHRRELCKLLDSTPLSRSISELDPKELQRSGIAALALDFDGVLANHGAPMPVLAGVAWLKQCEAVFGGERMFILSNKPTDERRDWFAKNFPTIRFIAGIRKKPFPDGVLRVGELAGVPISSLLMVDDRLLTGCLAALVAGARPCYIRHPCVSFTYLPVLELFFRLLRSTERLFVRLVSLF